MIDVCRGRKRRARDTHCSMMGAKADSFALRSARRNLRSSCHAGSAMRESKARPRWTLPESPQIRLFPGRPADQLTALRRPAPDEHNLQVDYYSIRLTLLHPLYSTMGRVLLKVLFYISSFNPSYLSHPTRSQGYHSGRQWVSPSTYPDTFL